MITEAIDICCIKHKTEFKATVRYFNSVFTVQDKKYYFHVNFNGCHGCCLDRQKLEKLETEKNRLKHLETTKDFLRAKAKEFSNIPARYNGVCFNSFTIAPRPQALQSILENYLDYKNNLKEFIERGRNIVSVGKKGRGKTHLAVSLLKMTLSECFTGRIDDHTTIVSRCLNRYDNRLLYASYDLLIIDELAVLDLQSHRNIINDLISDRYNNKKTTIINTYLPPVVTSTIIDPSRKAKLFEDCLFIDFDKYFDLNDDYDYRVWSGQTPKIKLTPFELRMGNDRD
jgi:DNA replication protein DnaC